MLLNIDLGELDDEPVELFSLAHLANVACGGHAGDARTMARAIDRCAEYKTRLGAHPSYPDREGFGRRTRTMSVEAIRATVASQCEALADVAHARGSTVTHMKPHGALYHDASRAEDLANALISGAVEALGYEIVVIGADTHAMRSATRRAGVGLLVEGFADRGMRADGTLVPRGETGAVLRSVEEAVAQCERLCRAGALGTLCVHGDHPAAVTMARAVRAWLDTRAQSGVRTT